MKSELRRAIEMLKISADYINRYCPDEIIDYDGTTCDGCCVADDCGNAAADLQVYLDELGG
mgnify:CR=1 FL=1